LKRVYRKPDPLLPDRDFAGELDELCRAKVAELVQSYLEAEVDELLGRLRYERRDGKGLDFAMATIPNVRSPRASVPKPTVAVEKVLNPSETPVAPFRLPELCASTAPTPAR
jgi:hypothetical protein